MTVGYGASAQAVGLSGLFLARRLMEVLRAKGVLSDEDIQNIINAAEADAGALNTVTGTEASKLLNGLAAGFDAGNA